MEGQVLISLLSWPVTEFKEMSWSWAREYLGWISGEHFSPKCGRHWNRLPSAVVTTKPDRVKTLTGFKSQAHGVTWSVLPQARSWLDVSAGSLPTRHILYFYDDKVHICPCNPTCSYSIKQNLFLPLLPCFSHINLFILSKSDHQYCTKL